VRSREMVQSRFAETRLAETLTLTRNPKPNPKPNPNHPNPILKP